MFVIATPAPPLVPSTTATMGPLLAPTPALPVPVPAYTWSAVGAVAPSAKTPHLMFTAAVGVAEMVTPVVVMDPAVGCAENPVVAFVSVSCCLFSWALAPVAVVPTDTVTLDKLEMSLGAVQTNVVGVEVHRFIVLVQSVAPAIVPADTCTKPLLPMFVNVNVIVSEPAENVEPLFAATKFVTVEGAEPMVDVVLVMTFVLLWVPIKSHPT